MKKDLVSKAYDGIYRRIIMLRYEPGSQLNEQELMDDLSIGRTPIREALRILASDMLVESQPKKGVLVRPITLQNTRAVFTALELFECDAAKLAVRHDNSELLDKMERVNGEMAEATRSMDAFGLVNSNSIFHNGLARCSKNIYLVEALRKVRGEANRLAYLSFANEIDPEKSLGDHYRRVISQHDEIIRLLRERNGDELCRCLHNHLGEFKQRIISYLAG